MDEFTGTSIYPEPDPNALDLATAMRRQFLAFTRMGFTEEHAIRLTIACIHAGSRA